MAKIVVGLGYGDEGKGSIVDYLTRQADRPVTVIRFNGGAQAAHNVVTPDGKHHTFAQFGSGTLAGARTHLGRFMLVDPFALHAEATHLASLFQEHDESFDDALNRVYDLITINKDCTIVTPFHVAANRIKEALRGNGRHGSCGMGIFEARSDREMGLCVKAGELTDPANHAVFRTITIIRRHKFAQFTTEQLDQAAEINEDLAVQVKMLRDEEAPGLFLESMRTMFLGIHVTEGMEVGTGDELIFEGAQGVLIDEHHGLKFPHVTPSNCTPDNARTLLTEMEYEGEIEVIGVTRVYHTRHGRGPFPQEDQYLTEHLQDTYNGTNAWQEGFRVGDLRPDYLKYAVECCGGVDEVAVTCLDQMIDGHFLSEEEEIHTIEKFAQAPVTIRSYGPTHTDKVWHPAATASASV